MWRLTSAVGAERENGHVVRSLVREGKQCVDEFGEGYVGVAGEVGLVGKALQAVGDVGACHFDQSVGVEQQGVAVGEFVV